MIRQMTTLHAGIQLPAAQVQDRGDRRASRSRGAALARLRGADRQERSKAGEIGFEVYAGGGMGRTPFIAYMIREFLPTEQIFSPICRRCCASGTATRGATTSTSSG